MKHKSVLYIALTMLPNPRTMELDSIKRKSVTDREKSLETKPLLYGCVLTMANMLMGTYPYLPGTATCRSLTDLD